MKWSQQCGEVKSVRVWLSRQDLEKLARSKVPLEFVCTASECSDSGRDDEWAEFTFERRDLRPPDGIHIEATKDAP